MKNRWTILYTILKNIILNSFENSSRPITSTNTFLFRFERLAPMTFPLSAQNQTKAMLDPDVYIIDILASNHGLMEQSWERNSHSLSPIHPVKSLMTSD